MTTVSAPTPRAGTAADRVTRVQRRTVAVLVMSQVLGGVGIAVGFAVGALLAVELSGSTELSGFAQTAGVLGAALAAVPLARLAGTRGRRPSLALGYAMGALGALLAVLAAAEGSYVLLLAGMVLFGSATAANQRRTSPAGSTGSGCRRCPGRSSGPQSGSPWRRWSSPHCCARTRWCWPGRAAA